MKIIAGSIDVTKIEKSRLVKGEKGTYYNILIMLNDEKDQYGNDCSISEGQTKEEREAKQKKKFIGNGKIVFASDTTKPVSKVVVNDSSNGSLTNDLPF